MASASFPTGATFAVIGTGVVGVATAFALAQRGYKVTVFDPFPPGMGGPSHRNAGHIAASDAQPLSTPGMALTGLKLLFKKDGPLKIPGAEKIRMIPWFLQFSLHVSGREISKRLQRDNVPLSPCHPRDGGHAG